MLKWVLVAVAGTVVSLIAGLACFLSLPDQMAVHWGWHDQPNGFLPKGLAIVVLPLTSLLSLPALAMFWAASRSVGDPAAKRALHRAGGGVAISLAFVTVYLMAVTVAWNLGHEFPLGWYILPAVVVVLGVLVLSQVPLLKLEWAASRQAARTLPKGIWFTAKRYGWGWGLPCAWQGWVVLGLWLAVLVGGILGILVRAPEGWAIPLCCLFLLLMAAVLMGLCAWRGEKPRWRWGDSD